MSTLSMVRRLPKALRNAAVAVSLALLTLGGGAMAANLPETAPVQASQPAPTAATALQAGDYAAREQALGAQALQQFQGGDTVIIGTSAVALVLVVLVLVVLL